MKVAQAVKLAEIIKGAVDKAAKHGGAGTDRGLGMRYAAYDMANDAWYDLLAAGSSSQALAKVYPNRDAWFKACGFRFAE